MEVPDWDFDDVLKMGPEKVRKVVLGIIARELDNCDSKFRALISIKVPEMREGRVNDMLRFLSYNNGRKRL